MTSETRQPRKRTPVSPRTYELLGAMRVVFRYSPGRDAYILRFVGHRFGPVWQKRV